MSEQNLFTLLHLSDFHFTKRKHRDQKIVVDALIADLKKLCIGHRKPDIIIFTGDMVQAAGQDLHDDAYDFLMDRVSKVTGLSDERIFIVPGNHDLSWDSLTKHSDATNEWRACLGLPDEMARLNALYEKGIFDEVVAEKFKSFLELENFMRSGDSINCQKIRNAFINVNHIDALNVDVVILNSAVFSTGGHKGFALDQSNLAFPEYPIMEAVSELHPDSLRIFAMHHPLNWLSEASSRYLDGQIAQHAGIHLFGHMHDPQPKNIVSLKGEVLADQAGAVFTSRKESYNGYSLITLDRSKNFTETLVRSFFPERNEFDAGIDIVKEGQWWSSESARQYFRTIATPVDDGDFRNHLAGPALKALSKREKLDSQDTAAHEKFVTPPLFRTFIREESQDESTVKTEEKVEFPDVVCGNGNLILYARAEYGRTTLLKELRFRFLSEAKSLKFPRLPVVFDFAEISSNWQNMLRKIKGNAEATPENNDIESLLKLGLICVMVDDVIFSDAKRMKILREFVSYFPKARYIFSSPHYSATQLGAFVDPEMATRFEFVEVRQLRRDDMRQLLKQDDRCDNVEKWLDRLQDEFREINLPFTAANGSIFIEILSEKYNFTPINRSVLMEQFVDSTLRKAAIEQSQRETFDYTNKTDLLSHIAAWMARQDEYVPTKETVRGEMASYINSKGLNVGIDALLAEFLTARIFIGRADQKISFRYKGVLEYFIALRMTIDADFKNWVLEEDRYLRYVNEIQYYAGKLRNDEALVNLVAERHEKILSEALSDIGDIDLKQLENTKVPSDEINGDLESVAVEIAQPPLSQQEKDTELEAQLPRDAEDRQEVFRPNVTDASDQIFLSLVLYSGLLKNMELISDAEKRKHLTHIWRGWSILLISALRYSPRLAKERRVRVNGAVYEVQAPHGMSDTSLLRRMMVLLPHIHIKMISAALGTEKLERQLTEPLLSEDGEPAIFDFLRTGLISDLGLSATPAAVSRLAEKLRNNKYLLWSLVVHIGELRRMGQVSEEHFKGLEEPLAGAIANLRGGTVKQRLDTKTKQRVRLQRERLMLTIKKEQNKP